METRWPYPQHKDVRSKAPSETHGITEVSGGEARPELVASLAVPAETSSRLNTDLLGEPIGVREVAQMIGCSPWTVRQRYLSAGLPHFRSSPNGKLIFYKNQVVHWLLRRQQKGGTIA
jgi:hypothetical protein